MSAKSFWDHPIEKLEEALHLKKQIHALQLKLRGLFESGDEAGLGKSSGKIRSAKNFASAGSVPKNTAPQAPKGAVSLGFVRPGVKATVRRKGGMTPEGRERIAAAQRARWSKARAGSTGTATAAKLGSSLKLAKNIVPVQQTHSLEVRERLAAAMKARWAAAKKKGLPAPNARK